MMFRKSAVSRLFELARSIAAWSARGRTFELDEVINPRSPRGGVIMPVVSDGGWTNVSRRHIFGQTLGKDYEPVWSQYLTEFHAYETDHWTVTDTGAGTSALVANFDGGALQVKNDGAGNNQLRQEQLVAASFLMVAGKPCIFAAKLSVDDLNLALFAVGMQLVNANAFAPPADGIWFSKTNNATPNVDFNVASAAAGLSTTAGVAVVASGVQKSFEFVYDGEKRVHYGVNGVELGFVTDANVPFVNALAPIFAIKNGSAVARNMQIDYLFSAKLR